MIVDMLTCMEQGVRSSLTSDNGSSTGFELSIFCRNLTLKPSSALCCFGNNDTATVYYVAVEFVSQVSYMNENEIYL